MLALKFLREPPTPIAMCAIPRLGQTLARVKILGASTPRGRNIVCRKKSTWVGPNSHVLVCGQWTKVHRTCLSERGRNRSRSHDFPIFDILSYSGDIRDESRKLCKIDRTFSGGKIFGLALKSWRMLITVQSLAAIGRRSSEILCLVKKLKKHQD